jgi:diphthamide biosynthesis protein 4
MAHNHGHENNSSSANKITHYDILDICTTATLQEIKSSYRSKVLLLHPDKANLTDHKNIDSGNNANNAANKNVQDNSHQFHLVQTAYEVLRDPSSRAVYDRQLASYNNQSSQLYNYAEVSFADLIEATSASDGKSFYTYPCRCGTEYKINEEDLVSEIEIYSCSGCSLNIRIADLEIEAIGEQDGSL